MDAIDELLEKLRMLKYDYDSMSTSLEDAIDDIAYELEQVIAATLGRGECEIVCCYEASTRGEVGRERVKLSCGHVVERHRKYCPVCGRKIRKAVKQ